MSIILKATNISKQYRLGIVGTGSLQHDLNRWWHQMRGKEDPYLKVGVVNNRAARTTEDYVWALRDINFEVKQGEVLGIIGKNGAGKSTLLKILSRVTSPTTGNIRTKGRIASLLEVGTGFHPELTGRENIYLNGAILGMTKGEVRTKLDEIIDFSGCEMYIDTPVKRYSSGMRVRLGFAVAAHLEPEILVVDEVLAVGDAEFQKKAIGKMQDLSKGEGRTVLFVSHNMVSVQQLCTRGVVLENGRTLFEGGVENAIETYLLDKKNTGNRNTVFPEVLQKLIIEDFYIKNREGKRIKELIVGSTFFFCIDLKNVSKEKIHINVRFQLLNRKEIITTLNTHHTNSTQCLNINQRILMECKIKKLNLAPGIYKLGIKIVDFDFMNILYENENFYEFEIHSGDYYNTGKIPNTKNLGKVLTDFRWQTKRL